VTIHSVFENQIDVLAVDRSVVSFLIEVGKSLLNLCFVLVRLHFLKAMICVAYRRIT